MIGLIEVTPSAEGDAEAIECLLCDHGVDVIIIGPRSRLTLKSLDNAIIRPAYKWIAKMDGRRRGHGPRDKWGKLK